MKLKPATEILLSAAFVLTPEENWCQEYAARDANGEAIESNDDRATRFCVAGAIWESCRALGYRFSQEGDACRAFEAAALTPAMGSWNDSHTHAEVLAALYAAAELSEAS